MAGDKIQRLEDHAARLPDDVLAAVLRHVPPRWLAASRCVCRAWRDAIDNCRLLRPDLLPLSLAGLFVHFAEHKFPEFFARPSSSAVSGDLSFLPSDSPRCGSIYDENCVDRDDYNIEDHCNGLLLLSGNYVVNPATRQWHTLPTCPSKRDAMNVIYRPHLVYDPVISPYYEVFMIPSLGDHDSKDRLDPLMEESEWPPSQCKMYVFSSKSDCWEERYFGREGGAAGIVGEMRVGYGYGYGYGQFNTVYFQGTLYVHCRPNFLMRISLSNNVYGVIKPPVHKLGDYYARLHVVRSKEGVYFAAFDKGWPENNDWLRVWVLNESRGRPEWVLKHVKTHNPMLSLHRFDRRVQWILEDVNYNLFLSSNYPEDSKKATIQENMEWNSDNEVENEEFRDVDYTHFNDDYIDMLGFHPYKEIVFLSVSQRTGLAYHLDGSKLERLGNIYPKEYTDFKESNNQREKIKSFPYTPCWIEESQCKQLV